MEGLRKAKKNLSQESRSSFEPGTNIIKHSHQSTINIRQIKDLFDVNNVCFPRKGKEISCNYL
jgi:hypothetical protein